MKSRKLTIFFIAGIASILSVVLSSFIVPDNDPIMMKIISQLGKWANDYPIEKVYLQLDKPYYAVGENIWFKAYITIGSQHHLSALSGTVNVELIDEKNSVKTWIKLPVVRGTAWGDFKLSDTLHEGNYRIRAYTNWMRNAGAEYYFDKVVTIVNAARDSVFTNSNYTYNTIKDQQKITAIINYSNINGKALASKTVNYTVQYVDKVVATGKSVTDYKGNIVFDFINPSPTQGNKGNIITDIKLNDNSTVNKMLTINSAAGKVDVQFFPESGNLVNGLSSIVAFKAVGPKGLGVNIKGIITDNENKKLADFSTQHLGMGTFNIIPQSGKTYKASITYADGSEAMFYLPAALNTGYILSINNRDADNISLNVAGSSDLVAGKNIYLVAQSGGTICYVGKSQAGGKDFNGMLPKSRFPSGIVQFTLFSSTGEPLNERVAFIQHEDSLLKLNISSKSVSAQRQKVRIELDAQSNGKPVFGNFSATVVDDNKVKYDEADETTILSHILLTADLRGYIEQPNYYFNQTNETTRSNLDILMLTQGYRRFAWKQVIAGTLAPPVYQPEKLIVLSGSVQTTGGKPVPGAKITLIAPDGAGQFIIDTLADSQGNFAFKGMFLKDSIRFIVKAYTAKGGKNAVVQIDRNANEDLATNSKYLSAIDFNKNDQLLTTYLKANKRWYEQEHKYGLGDHHIILKEVVIKDKQKAKVPYSSNLNGPGNANQIITGDELYKNFCIALDQYLPGRLLGVTFLNGLAYSARGGGIPPPKKIGTPMLFVLDGVPQEITESKDLLSRIQPSEVSSIEVLRDPGYIAIYGQRGVNGVIIITTKRAKDYMNENNIFNNRLTYSPKGYYRAREFYSPQYDDPKTNQSVADLRTTIYWKPNINTDKTGHAIFEYYNAGSPGTYHVIVEGIDGDGHIGREVYRYRVE